MTLRHLFILMTFFLFGNFHSQTTNAFRVNYNLALFDLPGNAVEGLTANTYLFAGTNMNFFPIYGTVTQVDNIGGLVWSKSYYDGSFGFQINDIKKDAAANEYYVCGGSESNAGVFMRLDANGAVVVSTKFSISQADGAYFNRVIKTSDGGYVAVGYVTGYDPDGVGPEIKYSPINYTDANGDPQTEVIGSPLIVKLDASGNHVWHKVTRYYNNAAKDPATQRIYNDASFNDVVEVSDGYIAVGSYDVNQHNSNTNSDGDDATANDALLFKTTTAGAIVYHKQYDALNFSPTQSSKYLTAISKTSIGDPIAAGSADNGKEWIIKFAPAGGFTSTFSRLFTYSSSFFGLDPVEISQIYEVAGSTDLVTMGMYIKPLSFVFSNSIHRVNPTATTNVWAKYYTFSLATILPRGSQTSDNGYIMSSTVMGGVDFDYHLVKTDPTGDTPLTGCAPVSFTPTASAGTTTTADPYYNAWSGTVGPSALAVIVATLSPTTSVQCSFVACTAPTISSQPTDVTICSTGSGNLTTTASAGPYQWQYNNAGTWTNVTSGTPAGFTFTNSTTNTMGITTTSAAQGTYQFRVIVGNTGCETTSNTVTVTVPGATRLAPTGAQCSGTQLNFDAFPTTGATYAWTVTPPGGTSATPTSGSGQTFSTTPTNTTGSTVSLSVNVNVTYNGVTCPVSFSPTINPVSTAPVVGTITQPTCSVSTGSVALSGLPSSGSWTVTASPGGTTIIGSGTTGTFSGLTAGTTYTFTVTNSFTCTSSASTNAIINAAPTPPTAPVVGTITQPTCSVATASVALSGLPSSGSWTVTASPGGATITGSGTTGSFTGLTAGTTYTFTVTNASGCTSVASTNAVINAAPTTPTAPIVGTITQPTCLISTGTVDFSGLPSSGTWTITLSPGGFTTTGTGTTGSMSGLSTGTYTFTVTNSGGCTSGSSTNATINTAPTVPTAPIVGTITQPTCASSTGSVALSGLPSLGSWTVTASPGGATITGSGTTGTFTGLTAGTTYTFTVTNSSPCTSPSSTNAAINTVPGAPTAPVIGTITQPTCSVSTGDIALSGLPSSGTWTVTVSPGGTTITGTGTTGSFTGLAAGTTYSFTVTNDLGCTSSASSNAVINSAPATPTAPIVGTITQPTCTVSTGSVDFSGLPSSGTWTLTASPGGTTATGTGTTGTFSGLATGNYTFTVTNSDGCISSASASATINTQPSTPTTPIIGTITQPTCSSPTGSVDLSGLPSSGTWTITSNPGGVTSTGTGTTTTFSGLVAGTTYTFTVTNSDGCTSSSSANAIINSVPGAPTAPTAGTVTQPTCAVPTGSIDVDSPLGANYTYSIDGVTFQSSTLFSGLNPGNYTITVTDNTSGCSSVSASAVTIDPVAGAPVVTLVSSTDVSCFGDTDGSLEISVSGGQAPYSYSWTPNVGSGAILTNLSAGSYSVIVTDDLGCSTTESFTIGSPNALAVNGIATDVDCAGTDGSITTAVSGGTSAYSYLWTPNGEITSGLTGLAAGNYGVTVTDDNGCTVTDNFVISTSGTLLVDIDPDYALIEAGETIQLTASGGDSYTWTPASGLSCTDCPNPIASPDETTVYYVTATAANGCVGGDTVMIEILQDCGELFVPNIFSPNGTGPAANNTLCVFGTPACIKELNFAVYNRWGEMIFETTDILECWDGTYKGKLMNSGIYVYKLNAVLYDDTVIEQSGNTTLVR